MDYYAILELTKQATLSEIKKNYRKLAMKWHPDKNLDNKQLAETKFKEIAEAYGVLSDPEKRIEYDNRGNLNLDFENLINPHDIFRNFFRTDITNDHLFSNNNPFSNDPFFSNNLTTSNRHGTSTSKQIYTRNGKTFVKTTITETRPDGTRVTRTETTIQR